jgi:hypothetical protein
MSQIAPPAPRVLIELSGSGDVQVGDTGDTIDTIYQVRVKEFPAKLSCN